MEFRKNNFLDVRKVIVEGAQRYAEGEKNGEKLEALLRLFFLPRESGEYPSAF